MFEENSIKTCIQQRVKQITSPGWMHETSAQTWCSGKTWRERVEREVGGGIGMGKTCKPKPFSFQCMTKFTTNKRKKKVKICKQGSWKLLPCFNWIYLFFKDFLMWTVFNVFSIKLCYNIASVFFFFFKLQLMWDITRGQTSPPALEGKILTLDCQRFTFSC